MESFAPALAREDDSFVSRPRIIQTNAESGWYHTGNSTHLSEKAALASHNNSQVNLLSGANIVQEDEVRTAAASLREYANALAPSGPSGLSTNPDEVSPPAPDLDANLQRIFEDRRYEPHLLRFLAKRMDPPASQSSGITVDQDAPVEVQQGTLPPSYRF